MNNIFYFILTFFFLIQLGDPVFAQRSAIEISIENHMEEAKEHMASGNYEDANLVFRKMLGFKAVLPSEMCYYFAETLFKLNQLQNSKNFINKYFQLTGTSGAYFKEVTALNDLVEEKFKEIKACNLCDEKGYRFAACTQCNGTGHLDQTCHYCKGKGITACLACAGKGVKITQNAFNEREYKSCTVCDAKGFTNCPTCDGIKGETVTCTTCKGVGNEKSNKICDHKHFVEAPSAESTHSH